MGKYVKLRTLKTALERWRIFSKEMPKTVCGSTNWTEKTVEINEVMVGEELLSTLLHEAAHVALPFLEEEYIVNVELTQMAVIKPHLQAIFEQMFD